VAYCESLVPGEISLRQVRGMINVVGDQIPGLTESLTGSARALISFQCGFYIVFVSIEANGRLAVVNR
jgi:hypothetical protein